MSFQTNQRACQWPKNQLLVQCEWHIIRTEGTNTGKICISRVQLPTGIFRSGCLGDRSQPVIVSSPHLNAQLYGSFKSVIFKEISGVDDDMRLQAVFLDLGPEWRRNSDVTQEGVERELEWRQIFCIIQDEDLKICQYIVFRLRYLWSNFVL